MGAVRDSRVEGIARTGVEGVRDATAADIVVDSEQGAKHSELTRLSRQGGASNVTCLSLDFGRLNFLTALSALRHHLAQSSAMKY